MQLKTVSVERKSGREKARGGVAGKTSTKQHYKLPREPGGSFSWLASREEESFIELMGQNSKEKAKNSSPTSNPELRFSHYNNCKQPIGAR